MVVGGAAGKSVRKADLLITVETTEQALEACELFFQYYRENANYLERTYDFVERLGIETIRKETVYAPEAEKRKLLDRLQRSKAIAKDAWLEREEPVIPRNLCKSNLWRIPRMNSGTPLDTHHKRRLHSASRRPVRHHWRERISHFQPWRSVRDHRKPVPASGRSVVRWHRFRRCRGLSAARLAI